MPNFITVIGHVNQASAFTQFLFHHFGDIKITFPIIYVSVTACLLDFTILAYIQQKVFINFMAIICKGTAAISYHDIGHGASTVACAVHL